MAATIDIPHIDQHYGTIRSRTIESTISPPTKTAIISFELVECRVAIMKRRLHYDMNNSINPTSALQYHSTSRTIKLTTMPPNRTTNNSYGTIRGHCAMIWSCNRRAGKGTAAGCYHWFPCTVQRQHYHPAFITSKLMSKLLNQTTIIRINLQEAAAP